MISPIEENGGFIEEMESIFSLEKLKTIFSSERHAFGKVTSKFFS